MSCSFGMLLFASSEWPAAPHGPGIHMSLTTNAGARSSAAQAELQSVALWTA